MEPAAPPSWEGRRDMPWLAMGVMAWFAAKDSQRCSGLRAPATLLLMRIVFGRVSGSPTCSQTQTTDGREHAHSGKLRQPLETFTQAASGQMPLALPIAPCPSGGGLLGGASSGTTHALEVRRGSEMVARVALLWCFRDVQICRVASCSMPLAGLRHTPSHCCCPAAMPPWKPTVDMPKRGLLASTVSSTSSSTTSPSVTLTASPWEPTGGVSLVIDRKEPLGVTATSGMASSPCPPCCPTANAHLAAVCGAELLAQTHTVAPPISATSRLRQYLPCSTGYAWKVRRLEPGRISLAPKGTALPLLLPREQASSPCSSHAVPPWCEALPDDVSPAGGE
mmetsp:Transcript_23885/g.66243  ORF Transcript_23885/g.66243 Transcript_23885/m.66243 type:complete len:337 (+) Transcript_23885:1848-2858(+)